MKSPFVVLRFSLFIGFVLVMVGFPPAISSAQTNIRIYDIQRMVSSNDIDAIKKLLSDQPELLKKRFSDQQSTFLHQAIHYRKPEITKALLELGAPTDVLNKQKRSPLHEAITRRSKVLDLIIEKTENIDVVDGNQMTPLMYLIMYQRNDPASLDRADKVIAKGADINIQNKSKQTALHIACYYNRAEFAKKLIAKGADVNVLDNNSNTPFLAACQVAPLLAKQMLESGADPVATNRQGQTALHLLAQSQGRNSADPETFKSIMDKYKDIDVKDKQGITPLYSAVFAEGAKFIELLIGRGADPNYVPVQSKNRQRFDPMICIAAQAGSSACLKSLVDGGARVNVVNAAGDSPLHLCAQASGNIFRAGATGKSGEPFIQSMKVLLDAKANVNAKNREGLTPFQVAAKRDFFGAVEVLAKACDSVDYEPGTGSNLHWCATNGLSQTAKKIMAGGSVDIDTLDSNSRTPLHVAAESGQVEIAKLLIKARAKTDQVDVDGATPLLLACANGHVDVANQLLYAGADSKKVDSSGQSALHLAAWNGSDKVVLALLRTQPDLNAKTSSGYSALHAAAWNGHEAVIANLLEAGANPNAVDSDGWTPLHKAAYRGHAKAVKALLARGANKSIKNGVEMTALDMAQGDDKKVITAMLK